MSKRKRASDRTAGRKNLKDRSASPHIVVHDPDQEYKARAILDQRTHKGVIEYLIEWEDDEITGEHFDPSWEPKRNANPLLREAWESVQQATVGAPTSIRANRVSSSASTPTPPKARTPKRVRGRPRKIVPGTALLEDTPLTNGHQEPFAEQVVEPEIEESQLADLQPPTSFAEGQSSVQSDSSVKSSTLPHATVEVSGPPSSWLAGEYELFDSSQVFTGTAPERASYQATQPGASESSDPLQSSSPPVTRADSPEPSQWLPDPAETDKTSAETTDFSLARTTTLSEVHVPNSTAPGEESANLVPDSQNLPGSESFVPSVTETDHSYETSAPTPDESATSSGNAAHLAIAASFTNHQDVQIASQPSGEVTNTFNSSATQNPSLPVGDEDDVEPPASRLSAAASRSSSITSSSQTPSFRVSQGRPIRNSPLRNSQVPSSPSSESDLQSQPGEGVRSHRSDSSVVQAVESIEVVKQASQRLESSLRGSDLLVFEDSASGTQSRSSAFHSQQQQHIDLQSTNRPASFNLTSPPVRNLLQDLTSYQLSPTRSVPASSFPFATQIERSPIAYGRYSAIRSSRPDRNITRASSLPVGGSLPAQPSSSIALPPSQSLPVSRFGGSAPPRPETLSSQLRPRTPRESMDFSHIVPPPGAIKAKAQENWERIISGQSVSSSSRRLSQMPSSLQQRQQQDSNSSAASSISPRLQVAHGPRSPSAIPAMEPLPHITREEMQTARRYETLLPQANTQSEDPSNRAQLSAMPSRSDAGPGDGMKLTGIYAMPILFDARQRDYYKQEVYEHRELVHRILHSSELREHDLRLGNDFIERMRQVTRHPDLVNPEALTQYDTDASVKADWDSKCSAKFLFLRVLFDNLRRKKLTVAILAPSGELHKLLSTFLEGSNVHFWRPEQRIANGEHKTLGDSLNVILIDGTSQLREDETPDLVIVFDNSVSPARQQMGVFRSKDSAWPPIVTLIVPRSVEHVEQCLSSTVRHGARTRALINGICHYTTLKEVGRAEQNTQNDPRGPAESAAALAEYVVALDTSAPWPLAELSTLENLDSQTESESDLDLPRPLPGAQKRGLDEADGVEGVENKRLRTDVANTSLGSHSAIAENLADAEVTHISESVNSPTQAAAAETVELTLTEKRLQDLLTAAQDRLEEHIQVLSDLQYRHEEQRALLIEVTLERDRAIATAQNAVTRFSEQSNQMSVLRTQNNDLKDQLADANAKLLQHSIPDRAEFESLRLALAAVEAEKERLEKRLEQANKDTAYVRELYQSSSSGAQTLASQVAELEEHNATLRRKASGEQAKLRQQAIDALTDKLQKENRRLRVVLREREVGLKVREEEISRLKDAGRGRMGTRGTSVPRSPRLGSPRVNSRQTSPAAGELKGRLLHQLRNS